MVGQIFIISFLVWAIYMTMQEGMIFEKLGIWLEETIDSEYWSKPIHSCVICMGFWHGLYIYWIVYGNGWKDCIITIISVVGLNAILSKITGSLTEIAETIKPPEKTEGEKAWEEVRRLIEQQKLKEK